MEKEMKKTVILIPGAYPEAAKSIFNAIKNKLKNAQYETVELEKADEDQLTSKGKAIKVKILVGKSYGGHLAVNYQLTYKDAKALILLAPAIKGRAEYKTIEVPVLILHGTDDQTIPLENSRKLKTYFKNCVLEEIMNANHGYEGKEAEAAKLIVDWLDPLKRKFANQKGIKKK